MLNYEELKINIKSGTIAAIAFGPQDGKPILAVHGWLDNAASFVPIAKYLPEYRIIAIDLPGHGHSSHKPESSYMHFVDYMPDIVFVLDELGWDKFGFLGHSLGAAVLGMVAGLIPDRVTTLCIIDAIGPYHASPNHLPDQMLQSIKEYRLISKKRLPKYNSKEEAIAARLKASPMQQSSVEHIVNRGLFLDSDNNYKWRTDPRLLVKSLIMFSESQVDSFLARITAPTCLVKSTDGWPFTEESYHNRKKIIKNLTIHEIKGKHHLHMDEAETVGKIFNDFFNNNF